MKLIVFLILSISLNAHEYHLTQTIKKLILNEVNKAEDLPARIQPHEMLEKIIKWKVSSKHFCRIMKSLDDQSLSIFENTINEDRFLPLFKHCHGQLIDRIEAYWIKEVAKSSLLRTDSTVKFNHTKEVSIDTKRNPYFGPSSFPLKDKEFILTFDDGPFSHTNKILEILKDYNVKALFFHVGDQVKYKPKISIDVSRDQHMLGSHSFSHRNLPSLGTIEAIKDIASGHQYLFNNIGYVDPFFRFPGGSRSSGIISQLNKRSISSFHWDIDPKDYSVNTSIDYIIETVLKGLRTKGKGIVLMHELRRSTWLALPTILQTLAKEGFTPVIPIAKDSSLKYDDPF